MEIARIAGGPFDCNIFLLRKDGMAILIDSGTGIGPGKVLGGIEEALEGDELMGVALTHEHFDHSGGARAVREKFGGEIWCSEACSRIVGGSNTAYTGAFLFGSAFEPLKEVKVITERLKAGPIDLRVLATPGHSRGSVCYFHEATGSLFSGDLVFCDGGVGRWDLPGGDLEVLKGSVKGLFDLEIGGLYPGHGRVERDDPGSELRAAADALGL